MTIMMSQNGFQIFKTLINTGSKIRFLGVSCTDDHLANTEHPRKEVVGLIEDFDLQFMI